ncbi:uncharacterized protein LOC141619402 [Silene latifolia]|uniref:uncharacterized protein LOC141619402 n=1 Tax=Silene latifolia TaxID=37657 RepID=UPI003D77C70A
MWSLHPEFEKVIREHWEVSITGTLMFQLTSKLKMLKYKLKMLNRDSFNDIENNTAIVLMALHQVQKELRVQPMHASLIDTERALSKDYALMMEAKHQFLAQKDKAEWVDDGDDNTAYFHVSIRAHRNRSKVVQINDMNGNCDTSAYGINEAFENYFKYILGTHKNVTSIHIPTVQKENVLTDELRQKLLKPVNGEEIRRAMFSIPGTKAPGPDGYNIQLLKQINNTILTLIPKVELPQSVAQFRPIACCNTDYKCIAKFMCNRLSEALPSIISPNQSAFVKGRDIVENILKAYDSIEWRFLEEMLCALGFPSQFTKLIMECVTTPSFSIALNGENFGFFKARRGIRQGDLMSSLLFTICMEYLSRILCEQKGDVKSVGILLRAFETFSCASGLCMNKGKSCLYSNGMDRGEVAGICELAGVTKGKLPFRYLGVPMATQKLGGLGVVDLRRWNVAALGKYIWWIAHKEDHLWVKWIHAIYMKNAAWFSYAPKITASWSWRKICGVKDKLKQGYVGSWWLKRGNPYTIQQGYSWLGGVVGQQVPWYHFVWNRYSLPKHCFMGWVAVQGRLLTKDRLMKMHICYDSECVLCGDDGEDHSHLFFRCAFSRLCLHLLNTMLHIQVPVTEYVEWWTRKRFKSLLRKKIIAACLQGLIYHIWDARNRCRIENRVPRPEMIVKLVKGDIEMRLQRMCKGREHDSYRQWIR